MHQTLPELMALWQKPPGVVPPDEERPELSHSLQWFREREQAGEQLKLIKRFQNNEPGVADLLVRIYYPLIKKLAGFGSRSSQRDWIDLTQEAIIALWFACARWDFTRESPSSYSYIYSYMRSYVRRYRMTSLEVVRHPVHHYERQTNRNKWGSPRTLPMNRSRSILFSELGEIHGLYNDGNGSRDRTFEDTLADEGELAEPLLSDEELRAKLPAVVLELAKGLSSRDLDMMMRRYGESEMTLEEIGQECGLTRERIRQIEVKVFTHFRERARALRCRVDKFRTFEEWAVALVNAVQMQKSEADKEVDNEGRHALLIAAVDRVALKLREEKALKVYSMNEEKSLKVHSAVESILAQAKLVRVRKRQVARVVLAHGANSFEARVATRKARAERAPRFLEALAETRRAIAETQRKAEKPDESDVDIRRPDLWWPSG